jgi:Right handed beta helix region
MQSIELLEPRIAPATFIVTNLADDGTGSLRDAVAQANDRTGADVITFKPGLTGMIPVLAGQMIVTDTLTIKGPGAEEVALSAMNSSRMFFAFDGDVTKDSPLSISGLSLFAGSFSGSGGAISSQESLTIKGCVLMDNRSDESGGAIDVFEQDGNVPLDVDIRNCTFRFNAAAEAGGAVSVTVTGAVTLKGNVFNTNAAARGGAAFVEGGAEKPVLLQNCRFISNGADQDGAVSVDGEVDGTVIVRDSHFADNSSTVAGSGAVTVNGGNAIVERSVFIRNTSQAGTGALQLDEISSLLIRSSKFLDNGAEGPGGGALTFSLADDGSARIIASIITGNTATQGGGILVTSGSGELKIIGSKITNNRAVGDGGGILVQEDFVSHESTGLKLVRTKLGGNATETGKGGGAAIFGDGIFSVEGSQVTQNSAATTGGGLFIVKTTPSVIIGSVIARNTAGGGGGIGAVASVQLIRTSVLGNIAGELGGGIQIVGELGLESCIISGNFARFGGGIFTNQAVVERNTRIIGNFSPDGEQVVID